jgi:hypothetical protein
MSPLIRGLTFGLWLIPLGFGVGAFRSGNPILFAAFCFLLALYGAVWIWCRPSRFVVSTRSLDIVFPACPTHWILEMKNRADYDSGNSGGGFPS